MDRSTTRYPRFAFALVLLGMMAATSAADRAALSSFRTIHVPGSNSTHATAINNRGMIVGDYFHGESPNNAGFIQIGRFFTGIEHLVSTSRFGAVLSGINDRGEIVGTFIERDSDNGKAFLFSRGELTTISVPDAVDWAATGINNKGKIVGGFLDQQSASRGFLFDGGAVTIIDVAGSIQTSPFGINDEDQIVGNFTDQSFISHGFLLSEGVYETIDVPHSDSTSVSAINNRGQIAGSYSVGTVERAFLLHRGKFTTVDLGVAGATINGINDHGQITGTYFDPATQQARGFTANIRELMD